jgi:hypothetical protein
MPRSASLTATLQNIQNQENTPTGEPMRVSTSTGIICWATSTSGVSDISGSFTEITISGTGGGEAIIDSDSEESLDNEDEHDSIDGVESSIGK